MDGWCQDPCLEPFTGLSGGGHGGAHASVEFAALGAVGEEVVGEGDAARFEDGDGAGAAEAEHAFFCAFGDWLAGRHGLDDAADVGGADFEEEDGAEAIGFESCEDAFVFPEIGETAAEGDGADGVELAVEESWGARGSGAGEVEAVVIDRAETAEDEGAGGVFCGEFVTAEERGEVELLTFDEDAVDLVGACEAEVAAVGREDDGCRVGVDGPCGGVEAAAEEVVEGGEGVGRVCEFRGVEMVVFDEGSDSGAAGWLVHAAAVPAGEGGAFDECGDDETADGVFVGGAEEALAVDGFLFEPAGVAVEESDRIAGHGRVQASWSSNWRSNDLRDMRRMRTTGRREPAAMRAVLRDPPVRGSAASVKPAACDWWKVRNRAVPRVREARRRAHQPDLR